MSRQCTGAAAVALLMLASTGPAKADVTPLGFKYTNHYIRFDNATGRELDIQLSYRVTLSSVAKATGVSETHKKLVQTGELIHEPGKYFEDVCVAVAVRTPTKLANEPATAYFSLTDVFHNRKPASFPHDHYVTPFRITLEDGKLDLTRMPDEPSWVEPVVLGVPVNTTPYAWRNICAKRRRRLSQLAQDRLSPIDPERRHFYSSATLRMI